MSFADWSTTASENTTVGTVNIGEGCPPGSLNDGIRTVMAQARAAFSKALGSFFSAPTIPEARVALKAVGVEGNEQMTANLIRKDAGPHLYHATAAYQSGRVFVTAAGAADPTTAAGDIWIELA